MDTSQLGIARKEYDTDILLSFSAFDSDQDGLLDRHQLVCAITALTGVKPGKDHVMQLLKQHGVDGQVPYEAFHKHMMGHLKSQDPDEYIRQVFKAFDVKSAGFISRETAHAVFVDAAPFVSTRVIDEVFDELDVDHDGRVSCREFIQMMKLRVP